MIRRCSSRFRHAASAVASRHNENERYFPGSVALLNRSAEMKPSIASSAGRSSSESSKYSALRPTFGHSSETTAIMTNSPEDLKSAHLTFTPMEREFLGLSYRCLKKSACATGKPPTAAYLRANPRGVFTNHFLRTVGQCRAVTILLANWHGRDHMRIVNWHSQSETAKALFR
jgi:hypothetical protein